MGHMAWDEGGQIGISSIDEQHRGLWALIDRLDERAAARAALAELRTTLDDLRNHTEIHFLHEEQFFGPSKFQRAPHHKREHDRLLLILKRFSQGLDAAAVSDNSVQHAAFLRGWLSSHIQNEDKLLGIHLKSLGIR